MPLARKLCTQLRAIFKSVFAYFNIRGKNETLQLGRGGERNAAYGLHAVRDGNALPWASEVRSAGHGNGSRLNRQLIASKRINPSRGAQIPSAEVNTFGGWLFFVCDFVSS